MKGLLSGLPIGDAINLAERAVTALERIAIALDCIAEAHGFVTPEPERASR